MNFTVNLNLLFVSGTFDGILKLLILNHVGKGYIHGMCGNICGIMWPYTSLSLFQQQNKKEKEGSFL